MPCFIMKSIWMPRRHRVEHSPELEALCLAGEIHAQQRYVADAPIALALKMVLRQPQRIVIQRFHQARQGQGFIEHRG